MKVKTLTIVLMGALIVPMSAALAQPKPIRG